MKKKISIAQKLKRYNRMMNQLNRLVANKAREMLVKNPSLEEVEEAVSDALNLLQDSSGTACAYAGHEDDSGYVLEVVSVLGYELDENEIIRLVKKKVKIRKE